MALPTAQLGQLGNMSMPYAIPTYEKGPNIFEKALATFLVNAAGGVAQQGAQNVMSRDYAKDVGQTPAGAWSKLVSGPQVTAEQAKQIRAEKFTAGENEADRMARAGQSDADAANALLRLDRQGQQGLDEQSLRDMNALLRGDREISASAAHDTRVIEGQNTRDQADLTNRRALLEREYELKRGMPDNQLTQTIVDRMRSQGLGTGQPQASTQGVNPNIAAFARNAGQAVTGAAAQGFDMPPAPDFVSGPDDVARMLQQGMTPEQILGIVQKQQMVNSAAQSHPLVSPDAAAPSQVDPRLAALVQQLGLSNQPLITSPRGRDY